MTKAYLKVHGFIALIALEPTKGGWVAKVVQRIAQAVCVLGTACLMAWAIAGATRSLVDEKRVEAAIERMLAPARPGATGTNERLLSEIETEIGGRVHLKLHPSDENSGLAVLVGVGEEPKTPETDPCARGLALARADAICLFRVRKLLGDAAPAALVETLVDFELPGTAYVIPHLVIAAAKERDPEMEFTVRRAAKVTQAVEALIGEHLFLPSSPEVAWGRRLNGPIQLAIYLLASTAVVMIALGWASSVWQNWAVRSVRTVALPSTVYVPDSARDGEALAEASDTAEGQTDEVKATELEELPTPWAEEFCLGYPLDLADAGRTTMYYEEVSRQIRNESEVLGVQIDPPALRLRLAAVRAVSNTQDTSILPAFLDAQKDAIVSLYDARMSVVRFLLWVIPTVGFIGTIIGVSAALTSTLGLQSSRDLVAGLAQSAVSASMGIAFDTTLVGLVATIVVMLAYHVAQGAEERMTVLERNRAEEEVMQVSRAIRKPGGPADLAQQLISLGINTEHLIRDIRLFERTGPELAAVIEELTRRCAELDRIDAAPTAKQRGWGMPQKAIALAFALGTAVVLGAGGYLGQGVEQTVQAAIEWFVEGN